MAIDKIVKTRYGLVNGTTRTTEDGVKYFAFMGIPYAKQPVGELRFRDPEPLEPWRGELDATKEGNYAYQMDCFHLKKGMNIEGLNENPLSIIGADDCLNLNVFTPNVKGRYPVLVWIHGGGNACNSATLEMYGPDYLVEKEIVVVTINYRLLFGFLSFKDETLGIPGNAGLKDQSMALRWVKENISFFGGDENRITLAGESSGGAAVHFHMISPMSEGLFQQAVLQSGTGYAQQMSMPETVSYEHELAKKLGWDGQGGDKEAFEVISKAEPIHLSTTILGLVTDFRKRIFGSAAIEPFQPRVEPYQSRLCFFPKSVVELSRNPWSKDMNVIIGANKDECIGTEAMVPFLVPLIEEDYQLLIPFHLRIQLDDKEREQAAEVLKKLYHSDGESISTKLPTIMEDMLVWHGIHRSLLRRKANASSGKTYMYIYAASVDPDLEVYSYFRQVNKISHNEGSNHTEEMWMIWKSIYSGKPEPRHKIYPVFEKFLGFYTNFLKTGDPNHPSLGVKWLTTEESASDSKFKCLLLTDQRAELVVVPHTDRMLIYDSIYKPGLLV